MKTLSRILILANFAAIVFIPSIYLNRYILILMFLAMSALVVLYWFAMFWVSKKNVEKVLKTEIENDFFAARIPSDPSSDLVRGRFFAQDGKLVLMQRTDDKTHKTTPCKEAWSIEIDKIKSVGFGKVLPARKGFIIYLEDDEISFVCAKVAKDRSLLYKVLGWDIESKVGS